MYAGLPLPAGFGLQWAGGYAEGNGGMKMFIGSCRDPGPYAGLPLPAGLGLQWAGGYAEGNGGLKISFVVAGSLYANSIFLAISFGST